MNCTQFTDFQAQHQLSPFQQNISLNNLIKYILIEKE